MRLDDIKKDVFNDLFAYVPEETVNKVIDVFLSKVTDHGLIRSLKDDDR